MLRWITGRGAKSHAVAAMQSRTPSVLWQRVLNTHPFLAALSPQEAAQLQTRAAWLLASKHINGAHGLALSDFMRLSIAAQASLPILHLSTALYEGWDEIIVYPYSFCISQHLQDDAGVVHEYLEEAAGQAWDGGPVILSWEDTCHAHPGVNVIIHEFAHKLDLQAGGADGVPAFAAHPEINAQAWRQVLAQRRRQFSHALNALEAGMGPDVDPDSLRGAAYYQQLPLDRYAATNAAEFFAVSTERFFVDPHPLAIAWPDWFALLQAYYRQDPRRPSMPP
jgi:Mlc titration factor MtfA (ptsG expression regulator)